jgi:hypothetical protein
MHFSRQGCFFNLQFHTCLFSISSLQLAARTRLMTMIRHRPYCKQLASLERIPSYQTHSLFRYSSISGIMLAGLSSTSTLAGSGQLLEQNQGMIIPTALPALPSQLQVGFLNSFT